METERAMCHIPAMAKVISPEQGSELERLYTELQESLGHQKAALKTGEPMAEVLEGLRPEREKAAAISRRIKEILDQ
jgi:uncharacterized coiled-coil DUF342 family protein